MASQPLGLPVSMRLQFAERFFVHPYLCKGHVPSVCQGATPLHVLTSWSLNLTRILPLIYF